MRKFLLTSFLVVIGRLYDAVTTSIYTPDLAHESNPLVKWFSAGWCIMIVFQVLLTAFVIACCYYYTFRFRPVIPVSPDYTFRQFISYMLYGDPSSFNKILHKTPVYTNTIFASTGYVVSRVLIVISFIVGTSTLMLILSPAYERIYRQGIPYSFYVIIGVAVFYFYRRFFLTYYKQYKMKS